MENNLFMEIDNCKVYLSQVASRAEKETFKIAVKELVQAINAYTKENAKIVIIELINAGIPSVTANKYVYFNLAASDASENFPSIYAILFKWHPFHHIEIVNADIIPVDMIGKCTDYVRWSDGIFRTTFYAGYRDGITSENWDTRTSCTKGYFNNLDEYLFHIFNDKYDTYYNSRAYLGLPCGKDRKGISKGAAIKNITDSFTAATKLLSEYPRGIDYKNHKGVSECSKIDWYYDALENVFTALREENKLDAAEFYVAMRDCVKEIEKKHFVATTTIKDTVKEE
mgnify:CR=1 FL=1